MRQKISFRIGLTLLIKIVRVQCACCGVTCKKKFDSFFDILGLSLFKFYNFFVYCYLPLTVHYYYMVYVSKEYIASP